MSRAGSGDLERAFDFDRRIRGQRRDADRRARVFALLAECRNHEVGGAIHHLWPVAKTDRRIYESAEPHHADHFIEIADRDLDLCQKIDGAGAGRFLSIVDRNRAAKLPLGDKLAIAVRPWLTSANVSRAQTSNPPH